MRETLQPDRWISINEAVARAGVQERTIRRWIAAGKLKSHRTASQRRVVQLASLEEMISITLPPTLEILEGRHEARVLPARDAFEDFASMVPPRAYPEGRSSRSIGQFYVIQLVPELSERRLKLGFTADLEARLAEHRGAAPTAQVLATWPCRRNWEPLLLEALTQDACARLATEIVDVDDLTAFLARAQSFFALLPQP